MQKATYPPLRTHKKLTKGQLGLHIFFILLSLCYVLPLILLISISFDGSSVTNFSLIPKVFTLNAYKMVFATPGRILNGYKVTTFYSVFGTLSSLVVMMMFAYSISRPNFVLRNPLTFILFFTTLFSGGLVSTYLLNTKYLHLRNTYWALILPNLGNVWHVFLMRTYFQDIPESILESATIDGANEWQKYLLIVLPLAVPSLATIGLLNFVSYWNSWYSALLYISEKSMRPLQYMLQIMLRNITEMKKAIEKGGDAAAMASVAKMPSEPLQMAMCIVAIGPVLLIFPFFQKYLSKGLTVGSVKG